LSSFSQQFLNSTAYWVASLQRDDGSFRDLEGGASIQETYYAVETLSMLNSTSLANLEAARAFAMKCQVRRGVDCGGISESPSLGERGADPMFAFFCLAILQTDV